MKIAIVGSRGITVNDLEEYMPKDVREIVSGGAKGVDTSAKEYALRNHIKLTEILPEYEKYGRAAPLKRNSQIIADVDMVLIFWDGKSKGTKNVIDKCRNSGIEHKIYIFQSKKPV